MQSRQSKGEAAFVFRKFYFTSANTGGHSDGGTFRLVHFALDSARRTDDRRSDGLVHARTARTNHCHDIAGTLATLHFLFNIATV